MKFIKTCINYDTNPEVFDAYKDKTFNEFLHHEKLTPNLIYFVQHSIAMVDKAAGLFTLIFHVFEKNNQITSLFQEK